MIRRFRLARATYHEQLAEQHHNVVTSAVELYEALGDTTDEAWQRVRALSSTDYHLAQTRLHANLSKLWHPDA